MHILIFTLVAFLSNLHFCTSTPVCEKVCVCNEDLTKVDCSRINTAIIPPVDMWPETVKELDLHSNFISMVDVEMTHNGLNSLRLNNNKIQNISLSVFGGLSNLKFLDLSDNDIEEIELETFYGLENLLTLNISYNKIKTLPQNVFYNLLDIEELAVSSNPFTFFEKLHFRENINLKKLIAANISAYQLPFDVFATVSKLEYLDLSANSFHEVPTDALRSAKSLKHLQLDANPIGELSQKSFRRLITLETLKMNRMPDLKNVGSETFSELVNLKILEMKVNKELVYIHADAFLGLFNDSTIQLKELDLELSRLSTLSAVPCKKLTKLNLQRNPWTCNCNMKWLRKCYIQEIYAADLRCNEPASIKNELLINIPVEDFVCQIYSAEVQEMIHHNRVLRAISLAFTCVVMITLGVLIILVIKFKSIKEWYKNKKRGRGAVYYVRAKNYPVDR